MRRRNAIPVYEFVPQIADFKEASEDLFEEEPGSRKYDYLQPTSRSSTSGSDFVSSSCNDSAPSLRDKSPVITAATEMYCDSMIQNPFSVDDYASVKRKQPASSNEFTPPQKKLSTVNVVSDSAKHPNPDNSEAIHKDLPPTILEDVMENELPYSSGHFVEVRCSRNAVHQEVCAKTKKIYER